MDPPSIHRRAYTQIKQVQAQRIGVMTAPNSNMTNGIGDTQNIQAQMNNTGEAWHAQKVNSPPSRWVGDAGFDAHSAEIEIQSPT